MVCFLAELIWLDVIAIQINANPSTINYQSNVFTNRIKQGSQFDVSLFNFCLQLLFLGPQGRVDVKIQSEVKTLTHIWTENRDRRASGPIHSIPSIPLHVYYSRYFDELKPLCFSQSSRIFSILNWFSKKKVAVEKTI